LNDDSRDVWDLCMEKLDWILHVTGFFGVRLTHRL
jgi:hypothetical protein